MRDWNYIDVYDPILNDFDLKPTYEGLKLTKRPKNPGNLIDLKPTYEGLKVEYSEDNVVETQNLKPAYEGLKEF